MTEISKTIVPEVVFRKARSGDMESCSLIDSMYLPDNVNASKRGFFREKTSTNQYDFFLDQGEFLVAEDDCNSILGYILALNAECQPIRNLFSQKDCFDIEDETIFQRESLVWIAKVAVKPFVANRGLGTALYECLFSQYPIYKWSFMTAVAIKPIINIPSRELHRKNGFKEIGKFRKWSEDLDAEIENSIVLRAL